MGAFLTFVGVVVAIFLWWRRFNRTHTTVMTALKRAETSLQKRAPQTLEKDPKTGVYRAPRREG
ncbi:MAG: hypothetical protein RLT05_11645 [Bauldia litoralis]